MLCFLHLEDWGDILPKGGRTIFTQTGEDVGKAGIVGAGLSLVLIYRSIRLYGWVGPINPGLSGSGEGNEGGMGRGGLRKGSEDPGPFVRLPKWCHSPRQ